MHIKYCLIWIFRSVLVFFFWFAFARLNAQTAHVTPECFNFLFILLGRFVHTFATGSIRYANHIDCLSLLMSVSSTIRSQQTSDQCTDCASPAFFCCSWILFWLTVRKVGGLGWDLVHMWRELFRMFSLFARKQRENRYKMIYFFEKWHIEFMQGWLFARHYEALIPSLSVTRLLN